eukprot:11182913-Lingulodinium_polyedra.AAC.1
MARGWPRVNRCLLLRRQCSTHLWALSATFSPELPDACPARGPRWKPLATVGPANDRLIGCVEH